MAYASVVHDVQDSMLSETSFQDFITNKATYLVQTSSMTYIDYLDHLKRCPGHSENEKLPLSDVLKAGTQVISARNQVFGMEMLHCSFSEGTDLGHVGSCPDMTVKRITEALDADMQGMHLEFFKRCMHEGECLATNFTSYCCSFMVLYLRDLPRTVSAVAFDQLGKLQLASDLQ